MSGVDKVGVRRYRPKKSLKSSIISIFIWSFWNRWHALLLSCLPKSPPVLSPVCLSLPLSPSLALSLPLSLSLSLFFFFFFFFFLLFRSLPPSSTNMATFWHSKVCVGLWLGESHKLKKWIFHQYISISIFSLRNHQANRSWTPEYCIFICFEWKLSHKSPPQAYPPPLPLVFISSDGKVYGNIKTDEVLNVGVPRGKMEEVVGGGIGGVF